jgi:hypothetical protein
MTSPLAYHLIWTTYGTWLPGDARGWIKCGVRGIQPPDPALEQQARDMMVGKKRSGPLIPRQADGDRIG